MTDKRRTAPVVGAGVLEREIGKPRDAWTVDDLVRVVESRGIRVVSLMHVGGDGWLKTLDFAPRDRNHLEAIVRGGERADGSSLFAGTGIPPNASDIVLRPRVESAFLDPFAVQPTLVLLCHHLDREGAPLPQSPDTIVRRAADELKRVTGLELRALGEVEYFLGKRWDETDIYGADDRGYHATSPFVFGEPLRRRALTILTDFGVAVKYGHSEVGYIEAKETQGIIWEQHEIELALAPLPDAADGILLTQWVLRNLAHQSGMRCNTDPMMLEGHAGNGLHFHFAPAKNGEPLPIRRSDRGLTDPARWIIGGFVELGVALMAFGNRTEASFVRLTQGKEAPTTIVWGEYDRHALVRLPVVPTDARGRALAAPTVEFRLPDGTALPHLLIAGAALAVIHGYESPDLDALLERTAAGRRGRGRASSARLPRNFAEVAAVLAKHRPHFERGGVFPPALMDRLIESPRSQR